MSVKPDRYVGRPLVRITECLVLRAIGHLSEQNDCALSQMAPQLQELYGIAGQWHEIVRQVMALDNYFESRMVASWQKTQSQCPAVSPQEFAQVVADRLFGT